MHLSASLRILGGPQDRRLLHSPAKRQVAERTCGRCRAKVRPADPEVAQALLPTWLLSGRLCALRPGSPRRSPSRPPRGRSWLPSLHPSSCERRGAAAPRRQRPLLAESGSGLLRQGFADCLYVSRTRRTMPGAVCNLGRQGQERTRRGKIGRKEAQPLSSSFL